MVIKKSVFEFWFIFYDYGIDIPKSMQNISNNFFSIPLFLEVCKVSIMNMGEGGHFFMAFLIIFYNCISKKHNEVGFTIVMIRLSGLKIEKRSCSFLFE